VVRRRDRGDGPGITAARTDKPLKELRTLVVPDLADHNA
jgi:hypothetical protein